MTAAFLSRKTLYGKSSSTLQQKSTARTDHK